MEKGARKRERARTTFAGNNRDTQLEKANWRVIPSWDHTKLSGYCWSLAVVITVYRWFYLIRTLCSLSISFCISLSSFRRSKWHCAIFRRRLTTRTSFARRRGLEMAIFRGLKPIIFTGSREKNIKYIVLSSLLSSFLLKINIRF